MFTTAQLTRTAATAVMIAALGTTAAAARPADGPLRPDRPTVSVPSTPSSSSSPSTQQWTAPRTEGPGVQPARRVAAAPAVPLTATVADDGTDWVPIAAVAAGLVALLMILAVVFGHRSPAHPFRARQV